MHRRHRSTIFGLTSGLLMLTSAGAVAQAPSGSAPGDAGAALFAPGELAWEAGPGSLPSGATFAVLEGDPAQEGEFTMRLRFPDGYTIPPHYHPVVEHVTVVQGTFLVGMGDEVDPSTFTPLPVGSFAAIQPGMRHFARADGEVIIQLHGTGPWSLTYVDPDDDPRGESDEE